MRQVPDWARSLRDRLGEDWLPIVCTGGRGALQHPAELIGIYYDTGPDPLGRPVLERARWGYVPRPRYDDAGAVVGGYVAMTAAPDAPAIVHRMAATNPTVTQIPAGLGRYGEHGSVVATCPACPREHRLGRLDWFRFLHTSRVSAPWADVSRLD